MGELFKRSSFLGAKV